MPDPLVVIVMRGFREALLARELAQMQQMAKHWLGVERALDAQIAALAQDLADEKAAGKVVSIWKVQRMQRYQLLMSQARGEMAQYAQWSLRTITGEQAAYAQLGIDHAIASIQASYPGRIGPFFNRLPVDAIENMVGLVGDGSPLLSLLRDTWGDGAAGMTRALVNGTALGWNPRRTAKAMTDGLGSTLQRQLTIARSEQLRVYRTSSQRQYEASGVVHRWRRICAHDDRVCAGCLAAEGSEYPTSHTFESHPNCRCSMIPMPDGAPAPTWLAAGNWLATQPEETQRAILGAGRFDIWKDGRVPFDRFAKTTRDATWGGAIVPATLQDLMQ